MTSFSEVVPKIFFKIFIRIRFPLDKAGFPLEGSRNEAGHAVGEAGHPLTIGVIAVDGEGEDIWSR